jgi:hypothetical protein
MDISTLLFGGWKALHQLCPDRPVDVERTYSGSSLYFGHSVFGFYGRCVGVSVSAYGLRLSVRGLSSKYLLPPIAISWQDIEQCTRTRFGLVGDALKVRVRGWPRPIYVGRFLWKYGDVYEYVINRWNTVNEKPSLK